MYVEHMSCDSLEALCAQLGLEAKLSKDGGKDGKSHL